MLSNRTAAPCVYRRPAPDLADLRRAPAAAPLPAAGRLDLARLARYCPLCDRRTTQQICQSHAIATLPSGALEPTASRVAPGMVIDRRFRLERALGEGAMGCVFEARQLSVDRPVALKFLNGIRPKDKEELRRFFREACVVSRIDHPNVVRVLEFGVDRDSHVPFIVMQLVEGRTLRALLEEEAPLAPDRALRLVAQVARGLTAIHGADLIHRDLKPSNLMVSTLASGDEHVTILDLGISKSPQSSPTNLDLSIPGMIVGTPRYMSPEQAAGLDVDHRTDLFSLGCILHEMLTGKLPFEHPMFITADACEAAQHRVRAQPGLSKRQRALSARLLEQHPDDRPRGADDVLDVLTAPRRLAKPWRWLGLRKA